jgi:uncharacterized protein YecE (DUF72 family)
VPTRRKPPSGGNGGDGGPAGARVLIGTSGWSYQHWVGPFYPKGTASSEWLSYYADRFETVEVNNTFYRLPSESMVRGWRERTPEGFCFAVKGSRFVTHFRKLRDTDASVDAFVRKARLLRDKLGVVLWQLPPDLTLDAELLDRFLAHLPRDVRHAVEFRNGSWLADEAYAVLRAHNVANVHVSSDEMPMDLTTTADFVYVRFHGLAGYHGAYVKRSLEPWADFLAEQSAAGRDAYVYFNNDWEAHAPADAVRLREMVEARSGRGA